jgi:hypothetical protein
MRKAMTIRDNSDLYTAVRELCRILDGLGSTTLSENLRGALSISSLPGEVLGEIGLAMKAIRDDVSYSQLEVRTRVDECLAYVNRALGLE